MQTEQEDLNRAVSRDTDKLRVEMSSEESERATPLLVCSLARK